MPVYDYINDSGLIIVDSTFINQQVINEYLNLFGSDLVTSANTPQGMLITAETLARIAIAENNAKLANQINPNLAGGIFLDAVMALTNPFGRLPSTSSIVYATLTGAAGTVIPAGSIVSETGSGDNNQFYTLVDNTIPSNGYLLDVQFNSIQTGPIPSAESDLTFIVTPILGWEGVIDSTAAILGTITQSDVAAREYRLTTLGTQGASVAQAIISGVSAVPGVLSMTFLENYTSTTQTIAGVTMVRNSIYACVDGTGIGSYSTVIGTLTGTPTTLVPEASQASSNGNVFATVNDVTIPASGSIDVLFIALQTGEITCPIGTLTTIVTPVSGWASVTNAFDTVNTQTVVIGVISGTSTTLVPAGSQASSNGNIFQTLEDVTIPASGFIQTTFQSVLSGAYTCPENTLTVIVTPVSGWNSVNNPNDNTSTGNVSTIAQALVSKKSAGAAYNNGPGVNISAQVVVPYSNQVQTILFDTPNLIQISVIANVKIVNAAQNTVDAVQTAILDYAAGLIPGVAGLTVGQNVSSFELAGAITRENPTIYVKSIYIALYPTVPTVPTEISIAIYEKAVIQASNIVVNVSTS